MSIIAWVDPKDHSDLRDTAGECCPCYHPQDLFYWIFTCDFIKSTIWVMFWAQKPLNLYVYVFKFAWLPVENRVSFVAYACSFVCFMFAAINYLFVLMTVDPHFKVFPRRRVWFWIWGLPENMVPKCTQDFDAWSMLIWKSSHTMATTTPRHTQSYASWGDPQEHRMCSWNILSTAGWFRGTPHVWNPPNNGYISMVTMVPG